jgi:hypothetical protein
VPLSDLGADAPADATGVTVERAVCWDWRRGEVQLVGPEGPSIELGEKGWDLRVLAPLLCDGRLAVIGDGDRYATAGVQRVAQVVDRGDRVELRLAGADESVRLVGWSSAAALQASVRSGGAAGASTEGSVDVRDDGRWELVVDLPSEPGWVTVELRV